MDRKQLYKLEKSALFDDDFKVFSQMIKFKDNKHKYNTKQQLKGYSDDKIIKQMFNLLLEQKEEIDELNRIIKVKDIKLRNKDKDNNDKSVFD
tara:strand:+ start:818 stop:1096 length:279 start_codon:yes stop_codon:yes gene_type:complete